MNSIVQPHSPNLNAIVFCLRNGLALLLLTAFPSIVPAQPVSDGWFDFAPGALKTDGVCEFDLRFLNERFAGENGFIEAKDGNFTYAKNGRPVRFWAVNGPPQELSGVELKKCARLLARYGVNLVRIHTPIFDKFGEPDLDKIQHAHEIVNVMKAEGIYTHFSIYFPLWFTPAANHPWLEGYDGNRHPFGALMFNPAFQAKYQSWVRALLTTPNTETGLSLISEPAVFGIEIQNEDSLFFWTFDEKNIPDPQMRLIEHQFGSWLTAKNGSLTSLAKRWNAPPLARDAFDEGRVAIRPLWNIANERSLRDQDTAAFLLETQTLFYRSTYESIRALGFRGLIHASNWATASPEVLGPLEKFSYCVGDFVDRHGYFECNHQGENAAWSIRNGHTYNDRSALRFDANAPGAQKQFVHPVMDPQYEDKPSMISETTFTRPNRYRSEAPFYFASYGALQDSDCIVHFAFDGDNWSVKPGYFMQQWTIATPAMLGQFPAAALLYRKGYIHSAEMVADVNLNINDLLELKGTPLPQDAAFDELRLKDVPRDVTSIQAGQRLDPLLHYVGRSQVRFSNNPTAVTSKNFTALIDRKNQTVQSITGQLALDYGKGTLTINSPKAQGLCGNLSAMGKSLLGDLEIESNMELGNVVVVSLDDEPIKTSRRMLLQVMSEERTSGFDTEIIDGDRKKIKDIGHEPWQIRDLQGKVTFKRSDASKLKFFPLDYQGNAVGNAKLGPVLELQKKVLYYLIKN